MNIEIAKQRFAAAIGAERVSDRPEDLVAYAGDYTEEAPREPCLVVTPESAEHVQEIVRTARAAGLSLTARVAGSNVGGLAIPPAGGVVVNLQRMNRVLEVDAENMYALIEPGVTWEQLKAHLERAQIPLRMGYPLSPPDTSIVANCLLDGLGNLSLRHGAMAEWIGGLEVVLPDGALLRTGAAAASDRWFVRGPLPDLTGLFVCWQGTTGIVTKLAFQLWPMPLHRRRLFLLFYERDDAFRAMRDLSRLQICDDLAGLSWPTGKMLFGIDKPTARDPDEPEFFLYVDLSGYIPLELELRGGLLSASLSEMRRRGARVEDPLDLRSLVRLNPSFAKFAEFPTRLEFLVDAPGGGLSWVGTYGPLSRFEAFGDRGVAIMEERGMPPVIVSRPMKGGHFGVMRFIVTFDKQDEAQRRAVRAMNAELVRAGLELGFIPYKTPPWVVSELLAERIDPTFRRTVEQIRSMFDPDRLMAPHCWPLGEPGQDR